MRSWKFIAMLLCVCMVIGTAAAADKALGIKDSYRINFVAPVRVGTDILPAGDYTIRHTMEGQDHIMVFHAVQGKTPEIKVKCTLVPLGQKAERNTTIYMLNAANERVLQELIFRGDTAKHVF